MRALTLYRANGSCALVPHCLLTELGVHFNAILMRFGPQGVEAVDGSISHAEYLAIHPNGYVPALATDGEIITEMPAVLTYISALAPRRNLLGDGPLHHAKVIEWTAWLSGSLHGIGFGMRFRPQRFTENVKLHSEVRRRGHDFIETCFTRIERRLQGRVFPVGEAETVVDYNLIIFWHWGLEIGFRMHELFPSYGMLVGRMELKRSVQQVVKMEGLQLSFQKPMEFGHGVT